MTQSSVKIAGFLVKAKKVDFEFSCMKLCIKISNLSFSLLPKIQKCLLKFELIVYRP